MATYLSGLLPRIVSGAGRFLSGTIGDIISGKKILSAVGTGLQKLFDQDFLTDEKRAKDEYIRNDPYLLARARKLQQERKDAEKKEGRTKKYEKEQKKAKKERKKERAETIGALKKDAGKRKEELKEWVMVEPRREAEPKTEKERRKEAIREMKKEMKGWKKTAPIKKIDVEKRKKVYSVADEFRKTKEFAAMEKFKKGPPPVPKRRRKLPDAPYYREPIGPRPKMDDWEKTAVARAGKKKAATARAMEKATALKKELQRKKVYELD